VLSGLVGKIKGMGHHGCCEAAAAPAAAPAAPAPAPAPAPMKATGNTNNNGLLILTPAQG
jgi:hypothetical protein